MKRKKKNKLWMLQAALCGVCILSAALLYQDYVTVPRKNRELVEALKTCFPEDIPPGGGSPGEKEEQAGREPEVSLIFALSRVSIRSSGLAYNPGEWHRLSGTAEQPGRTGVLSAEGLPGKLRHQWKFVPPGRLYFGRIKESDYLRSQHEQRGDVRESGQVRLL